MHGPGDKSPGGALAVQTSSRGFQTKPCLVRLYYDLIRSVLMLVLELTCIRDACSPKPNVLQMSADLKPEVTPGMSTHAG